MSSLLRRDWKDLLVKNNTFIIFVVLILMSSLASDKFLQVMNLRNILLQQAGPILVALGMLFVILAGGIDLSVGSVMALGATTAAVLMTHGVHIIISIIAAVTVGCIFGAISGSLVAFTRIQGFVATLAVMTIARGLSYVLSNGRPIPIEENIGALSAEKYGYPIIWLAALAVILAFIVHRYTGYGRKIIGIGSNENALLLAGVRTKRYILSTYMLSGSLAAIAGVFIASRTSTGSAGIGLGLELDAIAAVVIGGASLMGGRGFVMNTVVGALILGIISNIMNLAGVPSYPQDIIKGLIIIAAVLLQVITNKKTTLA